MVGLLVTVSAQATWIGTSPATGTIQSIQTNDLQDFYYTSVHLSVTIPNCGANVRDAVLPNKQASGVQVPSYQSMYNMVLSAKLAGSTIDIWADNINYTIFGQPVTMCTIHQMTIH
jgi:hypothetical protein